VRDEEDDNARVAQACDELGEPGDLVVSQRRGRFVEQRDPRLALDGAHDLQHLLLAERKIAGARARVDGQAMASENLLRCLAGALSGNAAPRVGWRGGEQEIALDAQLRHQGQLLEHARNA
jgi:predicted RNA-binding Zn ribbon-like protein